MKKIFLSSTGKDLWEYREAAFRAIQRVSGFHCIRMEDFSATDEEPLDYCTSRVEECEIFIGIIGFIYGSCPPENAKSFTEHEYEAAIKFNKTRLLFFAPDTFLLPANIRESDDSWNKQQNFRQKTKKQRIISEFDSPDSLATEIVTSLANLTGKGLLSIEVKEGEYEVIIEGSKTLTKQNITIDHNGFKLTTNDDDLYIQRVTLFPQSNTPPVVFDFRDGLIPNGLSFSRCSGAWTRKRLGSDIKHIEIDKPRFEEIIPGVMALLLEPQRGNFFENSSFPIPQSIELYPGTYTLWSEGTGYVSISGAIDGRVDTGNYFTFVLEEKGYVHVNISGEVTNVQLENGENKTSYIKSSDCPTYRGADSIVLKVKG